MSGRIDFFIVGAQKAGTTALDTMLRRHPGIEMASVKEAHFFDDEAVDWRRPDYERFHSLFSWTPGRRRGEATPITLYWPNALERLHAYNARAKLVIALRHPIYRALSHWRMERARGAEPLSFSAAIREGRARVAAAPEQAHRVFSYVERGYYDAQIERVLALFPRGQTFYYRTDDLFLRPHRTLAALWTFLEVDAPSEPTEKSYVTPVESPAAEISPADFALLHAEYAARYARMEALTGLDLEDWRSAGYREPMRPDA